MGTSLSKNRTLAPNKKVHDDIMNPLKGIVATRIAKFRQDVEAGNTEGDHLIQVNRIVGKLSFFEVDVDVDGEMVERIANIASSLVGRGGGSRLAKLAAQVIGDMPSSSASVVFATTDDIGGIYRLDVIYITYAFESYDSKEAEEGKGLLGKQNIVAGHIIKSSSSMGSIDHNTLRIIIADSFADASDSDTDRFNLYGALAGVALEQDEDAGKRSKTLQETWSQFSKRAARQPLGRPLITPKAQCQPFGKKTEG